MHPNAVLARLLCLLVGYVFGSFLTAEVIARAMEQRRAGEIVTVLPMSKNVGHQIELLEAEGFTKFEKIYE